MNENYSNTEYRPGSYEGDPRAGYRHGVVNGQSGVWVPVDQGRVPETVSTDPNSPSLGTDNSFYYADPYIVPGQGAGSPFAGMPYANSNAYSRDYGAPRPISANMNNAIPTPSPIVQLPPIVQPISLVPYASQNQPLVQYDPNVRPEVPETRTPEPVYRRKPFVGLSVLVVVLSSLTLLLGCLIPVGQAAIMNIINLFQMEELVGLINGDMNQLVPVIVGVLYVLAFVFVIVVLIDAVVKACTQKSVGKFHICNLLALICLVAAIVLSLLLLKTTLVENISAIVMAEVVLIGMIVVGFANREAIVLDYVASKQTFIMK